MRDAPGEPTVVKLAHSILECAKRNPSLIDRNLGPDAFPSAARIVNDLVQAAMASQPHHAEIGPLPGPRSRPASMPPAWVRSQPRQRVSVARYIVPAACVVAGLLSLVAILTPAPRQSAPMPTQAAEVAVIDDQAVLAELQRESARNAAEVAQLTRERDDLRAKVAALSAETAEAARPLTESPEQPAPPVEVTQQVGSAAPPVLEPRHSDTAHNHPLRPAAQEPKLHTAPMPQAEYAMSSISRQLLQARAALANGDRQGARGMMKEAQTQIVFQPGKASPAHASVAASQISQALMMLTNGNDERALGYLDQALTAIQRMS